MMAAAGSPCKDSSAPVRSSLALRQVFRKDVHPTQRTAASRTTTNEDATSTVQDQTVARGSELHREQVGASTDKSI
ncbi:unnamed protein product, partial [Amoebophrya sp. A120]|eukprot:GSA120T00024336001.1